MRLRRLKRFGSTTSAVPSQLLLTTSTGRVGLRFASASAAEAPISRAARSDATNGFMPGSCRPEVAQAPVDLGLDVERFLAAGGAAGVGRLQHLADLQLAVGSGRPCRGPALVGGDAAAADLLVRAAA